MFPDLSICLSVCLSVAEWQEDHTERHLTNTDGVTPRVSCHKLPADIDQYQLDQYRDNYCKVSSILSPPHFLGLLPTILGLMIQVEQLSRCVCVSV